MQVWRLPPLTIPIVQMTRMVAKFHPTPHLNAITTVASLQLHAPFRGFAILDCLHRELTLMLDLQNHNLLVWWLCDLV
jgi:hypothetical protein